MSVMEINALNALIDSSEGVGYTLPDELVEAHRTYRRLLDIGLPEQEYLSIDVAAARVVTATATGNKLDLEAVAREVTDADYQRRVYDRGASIVRAAVEQAANAATMLAGDLTERIITEHLSPVLKQIHAEVAEAAKALAGHGTDTHRLITAPAKARNAWASLPTLADRRAGIFAARRHANVIGHRKPQHDASNLFSTFRKPLAFHPTWKPPAAIPRIPFPEDRIEALLWIVNEETATAEPWLPTIAQQDQAWWDQFGEGIEKRRRAHQDGVAVGARIGA